MKYDKLGHGGLEEPSRNSDEEDSGVDPTSFFASVTPIKISCFGAEDNWIDVESTEKKSIKSRIGSSQKILPSKVTEVHSNAFDDDDIWVEDKPRKINRPSKETQVSKDTAVHRGSQSGGSNTPKAPNEYKSYRISNIKKSKISHEEKIPEAIEVSKDSIIESIGSTMNRMEEAHEEKNTPKSRKKSKKSKKPTIDLIERASIMHGEREGLESGSMLSATPTSVDEKAESTATLAKIAQERAKSVMDIALHLLIVQVLLFLQRRNCEIGADLLENLVTDKDRIDTIDSLSECDIKFEISNLNTEFSIAIAIAAYGLLLPMIVLFHASFVKDHSAPKIHNIFECTDRIPIFDSLLEIPICMWHAPFLTTFLWINFLACCVGIVFFGLEYQAAAEIETLDNPNLTAFALNAFLVLYDLYRLTGDIAQYYVTYTEAKRGTREREQIFLWKYHSFLQRKNVREDA